MGLQLAGAASCAGQPAAQHSLHSAEFCGLAHSLQQLTEKAGWLHKVSCCCCWAVVGSLIWQPARRSGKLQLQQQQQQPAP